MADLRISDLSAATPLSDVEQVPLADSGVTVRATTFQLRNQGGSLTASSTASGKLVVGAVGPSGEPGSQYGAAGDSVLYRIDHGVTLALSGTDKFTIRCVEADLSFELGVNGLKLSTGFVSVNTAVGVNSLVSAASPSAGNTAIGEDALRNLVGNGGDCTAIGYQALKNLSNPTIGNHVAVGSLALTATTAGNFNTAVGANALLTNTTGTFNVAVGSDALRSTTTVVGTAIGSSALRATNAGSGSHVAVGYQAGLANVGGSFSTVVGYQIAQLATTMDTVVAFGRNVLQSVVTSNETVAVGYNALNALTSTNHVAIGANASALVTSGNNTVAIGNQANQNTTTLAQIVAVGYQSGPTSNAVGDRSIAVGYTARANDYGIALGANANAGASGAVALGTDSGGTGASTAVANEFKVGTSNHTMTVGGQLRTTAGTSTFAARVGCTTFETFADVTNVNAAETDLVVNSIVANSLVMNGGKLAGRYYGNTANNGNSKTVRAYFAGTLVGSMNTTTAARDWSAEIDVIRESATVVRVQFRGQYNNSSGVTTYTRITGLSLTTTAYDLKITGQGAATSDITNTMSRVEANGAA